MENIPDNSARVPPDARPSFARRCFGILLVVLGIVSAIVGGLAKIYARNRFDSGIFYLAGVLVVFGLLFYFRRQLDIPPSRIGKWLGRVLFVAGIGVLVIAGLLLSGYGRKDAMLIGFGMIMYGVVLKPGR
ncbi:MAG: hypothetical protein ACHRHE_01905 [Tepidisphaerales bacterium]